MFGHAPRTLARHRGATRPHMARERPPTYADTPVAAGAVDSGFNDTLTQLLGTACDPDRLAGLGDEELRQQVQLARRMEGSAALLLARATHELQQRGVFEAEGTPSTTDWLKLNTGASGRTASREARLASSVHELPETAAALSEGRLGVESADTIVRAAGDTTLGSPDVVEATLLPVATSSSPEELRAEVRRREQEVDADAMLRDERRQHIRRRLALTRRHDGMWDIYGRLANEAGNQLRTLLDVFDLPDPEDTPEGHRRRPEQRLADALDAAARAALDVGDVPQTGGVARPHISVVVDLQTFDADLTDPDDPDRAVPPDHPTWSRLPGGQTDWGGAMSPQATRRLCCDAGVSRVVTAGESQVLDIGRLTRQWSPAQRRAIRVRDRHCRGPNCNRPIGWTEVHHLQWWRHGGHTAVDNGLALCHACHRLIHDLGWHAELDVATAAVTWTSPDRRRTVVTHPRRPS